MPLKLIPPRAGKSKNWSIRGTYLGIGVDKSCGTDKRSVSLKFLKRLEKQIENGEYPPRQAIPGPEVPTFLSAARKYMEAGGEARYMAPLIRYFGETPLSDIDQDAIDEAAKALRPATTGATKNRCVYTPASSVLKHAGVKLDLKRPIDAKAKTLTDALSEADAAEIIRQAKSFDPEYAVLLKFLLYTGCRIGEALRLTWDDVKLSSGTAKLRLRKNGHPLTVRLRGDLCEALGTLKRRDDGRVFRFRQGGWLKWNLLRARMQACGLPAPVRPKRGEKRSVPTHRLSWVNHHTFRHTWATWMREYGGLDITGLKATGQWRDERSASRYIHAVPRQEWSQVESLPDVEEISRERSANKVHGFSTS